MATRRPIKNPPAGGGKPPMPPGPAKLKRIGGNGRQGTLVKVTGKGARGIGLGLGGKGRNITKKGYTGQGAYGYGQGNHGVAPKPGMTHRPPGHQAGTRRAPGHNT